MIVTENFAAACVNAGEICLNSLPKTPANGSFVELVLSIVIGIIAVVSVLFVAIGGLRYVFSQGDPQAVSKAKGTIVFALIGLVIAIVAQGLIVLVIKGVNS